MKSVAILTTFRSLPSTYGLVPVVLKQLEMLVKNGYEPTLCVTPTFIKHKDRKRVPKGVVVNACVPDVHLFHYFEGTEKQTHDIDAVGALVPDKPYAPITNFDRQVAVIEKMLEPELIKHDVVITHDILFQVAFVTHNQAIRNIAARNEHLQWIHWLHSGPSLPPVNLRYPHNLRHSGMQNSVWVSPNDAMRSGFADMYRVPLKRVRHVYHVSDVDVFFDMHPQSVELIEKHRLYDCDALSVFPCRMDAPDAKGMFEAVRLMGMLNRFLDAKILFLSSSVRGREGNIKRVKTEAKKWRVPEENIIFSSDMGKKWKKGVDRKVVRDMQWIANIFIYPSKTETFSMVLLEAALAKNLLVVNGDLGVFRELCGDRVEYIEVGSDWGGRRDTRHHWENFPADTDMTPYRDAGVNVEKTEDGWRIPNEELYWLGKAEKIAAKLGFLDFTCEHCGESLEKGFGWYKPLMQQRYALKTFWDEQIWKTQFEPLIEARYN